VPAIVAYTVPFPVRGERGDCIYSPELPRNEEKRREKTKDRTSEQAEFSVALFSVLATRPGVAVVRSASFVAG